MNRTSRIISRESFGRKVLLSFIAVIVLVLSAYTFFAAVNESKTAKEGLREKGEMLSGLLAHSAVTGVFAENEDMVANIAEGTVGLKDVSRVAIFNAEMKVLYDSTGKGPYPERIQHATKLKPGPNVSIEETEDTFEFIRPVLISSVPSADESLYFRSASGERHNKVIGFVWIVLSKDSYRKAIHFLVLRNAVIMLVLAGAGVIVIILAVKKVTRPLKNLTESVKAMGEGLSVEQVPVETNDELGNLAAAFNNMLVARGRAEEEILAYHERLAAMSSDLSLVEERERRSIATNLHDTIGQILAVSKIKLGLISKSEGKGRLSKDLGEVREMIDNCIQYTRSLTFELSPPVLYEFGLEAALEMLGAQIGQQHSLSVSVEKEGAAGEPLSDEVKVLLFKTVRELLMNVVKHADAKTVRIFVYNDAARIRLTVEDDGKGFDIEKSGICSGKGGGFGLFSVRERLKYLNGQFEVESALGRGTRIVVSAPRVSPERKKEEASSWKR